jgi:hypothetical protein
VDAQRRHPAIINMLGRPWQGNLFEEFQTITREVANLQKQLSSLKV